MKITTKKFIGGIVIGTVIGLVLGSLVMTAVWGNYIINVMM
jgi:F0F1-type ATP synthase assembly protein I